MEENMDVRIKICGMRDVNNIAQVASFRPDYMGFIAYPGSPRYIGEEFIMPTTLPSGIRRVGVFVNEKTEMIVQKTSALGLDYVQLHGHETPDQCMRLKDEGLKIIKVFSVDDDFDFESTQLYTSSADYFLFDTKGRYFGGNAKTFNWELLKRYNQKVPFFLSGGLSPENIGFIANLKGMNLHALDINSGVEDSPGMKSTDKLRELFTHLGQKDREKDSGITHA